MPIQQAYTGWQDDNAQVQLAREQFLRRLEKTLQAAGLPSAIQPPSDRRLAAGIDTRSSYTFPLLFYPAFPDISLAQLRSLSLCGSYLFDYVLSLDSLLDQSALNDARTLFLSLDLQREALSVLYSYFPPGSSFWDYFDRYHTHFVQAILCEREQHHCLITPYTEEELSFIYSGKPAVAKIGIAALALLGQREDLIEPLTASHDAFQTAYQLLDDLQDWQTDYQHQIYSYPLTVAILKAGWKQRVESSKRPLSSEIQALLEESGTVEEARTLALVQLEIAEQALDGLIDIPWKAAIHQIRQSIKSFEFGAEIPLTIPASHAAPASMQWPTVFETPAAPIAFEWLSWLDHNRKPHIDATELLSIQHQRLRSMPSADTLGEVLCQIGLTIAGTYALYPQYDLATHLGMSSGELEWCHRNLHWLNTLLPQSLSVAPYWWTPQSSGTEATSKPGWVPPAVGRYLGYYLVETYRRETLSPGEPAPSQILGYYQRCLIA